MKYLTIITLCLAILAHTQGQNEDVFGPTTIYITDAIGNVDSVTLGWLDRESSADMTELGEENIVGQPWDTILEARLANGPLFWSRPNIERQTYYYNVEFNNRPGVRRCPHILGTARLLVHAKHLPVTIEWDSSFYINNACFWNHAVVNHDIWSEIHPFDTETWSLFGADSLDNICMFDNNTYITDLSPIAENLGWTDFAYDFALDNGDTVRHGAIAITGDVFFSCNFTGVVSTSDLPHTSIHAYPNPATDHQITLHAPDVTDIQHIRVVDITGQVMIDRRTDLPERLVDYVLTIPDEVHGLVIVQVVTGEGTWTENIVVE